MKKKPMEMDGKDVLQYAEGALKKKFPATELAEIVYDMDYAHIGKLIGELHEYYSGESFTFQVDGDNCLEEIFIQLVFASLDFIMVPFEFHVWNKTMSIRERVLVNREWSKEQIETKLKEWIDQTTRNKWFGSEQSSSYQRIFEDKAGLDSQACPW